MFQFAKLLPGMQEALGPSMMAYTPTVPALWRWQQGDWELKVILHMESEPSLCQEQIKILHRLKVSDAWQWYSRVDTGSQVLVTMTHDLKNVFSFSGLLFLHPLLEGVAWPSAGCQCLPLSLGTWKPAVLKQCAAEGCHAQYD